MFKHPLIQANMSRWQTYWNSRTGREQRMLLIAASVIAIGLIYGLLYDPAQTGVARLNKELPPLRSQAAEMAGLAKQAMGLRSGSKPISVPANQLKEAIAGSLTRQGFNAKVIQESDLVHVELSEVAFAKWLEWLRINQAELGVLVVKATIKKMDGATPSPGVVSVGCWLKSASADS
ncbi:type II secretion system protein GspM [Ampullimonas aquatilis]|uniref:type II secretion system protein GspM n=1 Tax=Ampullimonas aquatilis TaxID=1341549 RepID=UPI003C766AE6